MGAWDKFLGRTKGNEGKKAEDVKQTADIYEKAADVYMNPALKGMEELDKDVKNEQKIKIAGAKRFKEGIIRDLENNLLKAENLGIDNLDNYRQLLDDLRNFQIPNEVSKETETVLNRARKIVNRFGTELEIDGFWNEIPNYKETEPTRKGQSGNLNDKMAELQRLTKENKRLEEMLRTKREINK